MKFTLPLILASYMGVASAGTYTFTDTSENEDAPRIALCRDFMENLKRLGSPPMVCDRTFHPSMKQFTWPQWKSIDPIVNRSLVEQIWQHDYGWAEDETSSRVRTHLIEAKEARQSHANWRATFEEMVRSGDTRLAVTRVPVDGDPTMVLRFSAGENASPCDPNGGESAYPIWRYFIVDRQVKTINFQATDQSVFYGLYGYVENMRPDLFLYRGKPTIAYWYGYAQSSGGLQIFEDYNNYCLIDFTSTKTRTKEGKKR